MRFVNAAGKPLPPAEAERRSRLFLIQQGHPLPAGPISDDEGELIADRFLRNVGRKPDREKA
jgi:hypothetical protein